MKEDSVVIVTRKPSLDMETGSTGKSGMMVDVEQFFANGQALGYYIGRFEGRWVFARQSSGFPLYSDGFAPLFRTKEQCVEYGTKHIIDMMVEYVTKMSWQCGY